MFPIHRYVLLLERLHVSVFGVSMGDTTRLFLRQLQWSVTGGLIASGSLFAVSVWAGRLLGTAQYGKYSFALALAQIIAMAMTLSFEIAIVRALVFIRGDALSQTYIVSSALFFLVVNIIFIHSILFLLSLSFLNEFIVLFATVLAVKSLLDGMMRGLGFFAYQAVGKTIEAFVVVVFFVVLVRFGFLHSYAEYLLAMFAGVAVSLVWYAIRIRSDVSAHRISSSAFQVLWTYGSHAIFWLALPTILGFAARFIIGYRLGYEFLGQFTVYYTVSVAMLSFMGGLVANVLFPLAMEEGKSHSIWHKMNRISLYTWLPLWVLSAFATNIAIMLYGESYYLAWWFAFGMAGVGVSQFLCGMYWLLVASQGITGVKYASIHAGIGGVLFIACLASTIPRYPMGGIVLSYVLSDLYMVWAILRWHRKSLL